MDEQEQDVTFKIEFDGYPQAAIAPLPLDEGSKEPVQLWGWIPFWMPAFKPPKQPLGWQYADKARLEHPPVLLAFSIDSKPKPEPIYMLNPLPLPQVGEYALIEKEYGGQLEQYHILQLPLIARHRWVELGEALRKLSQPLLWPAFAERHVVASDEGKYNQRLLSLKGQQGLFLRRKDRESLIIQEALLIAAYLHIEELKKAIEKEGWHEQWLEVQRMARQLSDDYYAYHIEQHPRAQATQDDTLLPVVDIDQAVVTQLPFDNMAGAEPLPTIPATPAKRKGSRPMQSPTAIVSKRQESISISSHTFSRGLIPLLRDKQMYTEYQEHGVASATHTLDKQKGSIRIDLKPTEGEGWDTVLNALNTLGDEVVDTYFAVMAIAIERNGVQNIRTPFQINPDDILGVCGKEKSNRSYTPLQKAEVIKHLKTLSMAKVIATLPGRPGKKRPRGRKRKGDDPTIIRIEGAIVDLLSFKIGEYSTITGEEVWERRSIAIGEWATMIPDLSSQTATMLRQVLKYSAKNQRYQKRIGIFLTCMFRVNAKRGGTFPHDVSMGALLAGSGILVPREAGKFKESIERALEQLKADRVIGDYWQVVDSSPGSEQIEKDLREHARGWVDLWLDRKWNFSPPQYILEQYRTLLKEASQAD